MFILRQTRTVVLTAGLVALFQIGYSTYAASVKTRVDRDKTFDFSTVKTWAWNPIAPGKVGMARFPEDDAEEVRKRFEPTVLDSVAAPFAKRAITMSQPNTADVLLSYYLIVTGGSNAQTAGQFLPPVTEWPMPLFLPATTSLKFIQEGTLVVDATSQTTNRIVWRGIARTELMENRTDDQRRVRLREGMEELIKRFPKR